ncbi:sorbin and SH3 domain-containing protein 1 homolog isoform X2 [Heptranchias perlo]|uniref:sorbin and SH3 domain-containing protein 1 homolog isoform X2 n=1 Tax=Heptranchias perlo TaxID=212740 RepID=UPI00355A7AF4
MKSVWNPCSLAGEPQNSLAAKGFRSVRPKFLISGRKPPVQPSIHNVIVDIKENSHNARAKESLSSELPNQEASSVRSQSNIPCDTETDELSSSLGPNHNVPYTTETESPASSVSTTCKVLCNSKVDNSASSDDPMELHNSETELQVTEIVSSDSETDIDPVYKVRLQTVSEKMNIAIRSSSNSMLTSEKRSSPLITKEVPVEDGPKTWYKSMFKGGYSVLKAEDYGMSSIVDAKKKWEPDPTKQQPLSSSATGYRSRSQLTGPLPYNSTTKDNYTIKWPLLSEPLSSSENEEQNCSPQSQCLRSNISDSKSVQSSSIPLSASLRDTIDWNCQNYTAPSSDCQPTRSTEMPCNSLAAKEPHSISSTKVTVEENNQSPPNGKIDTRSFRVEPRSVFDYEPGKSSDYDHPTPTQNTISGNALIRKTRSFPTLAESASQLTIDDTVRHNGSDTDLSQLKCLAIRQHSSADLTSIDSENEEQSLAAVPKHPGVNQSFQTQKQKMPEETCDLRQQLKMGLTVRAKYDFYGQTSKELPVRKGDIIFIHRQMDHNWYEGECNRQSGLLPICYVEPVSELQTHLQETLEEVAIAKFRFAALTNIELPLEKNQTVVLLRRIDENWYEGKYPGTNRKGIFPVTYVEVIGKTQDEPVCHRDLPTSGSDLKKKMASQRPFQQLQLRSTNFENIQSGEETYLALYSFLPNKDDELELRQGDLVNVIKKCGDGWYLGTSIRTKKFGTFPGNYVNKLCL